YDKTELTPNTRCLVLIVQLFLNAFESAVFFVQHIYAVKEGSLATSNELNYLNHSKVTESEEEANKALDSALKNHTLLKKQIEQQKAINDAYQRQIETLRTEKTSLQSNISFFEGGCGKCHTPWIFYNSSCYFFSNLESADVKKNWVESKADCVNRGADLAVIDDQEEQKFVSDTIKAVKSNPSSWTNGFWVGLTDMETEGTWVWINNVTEVEQRYWMDGEPNNHGLDGENCCITAYSSFNPWKTRYDGKCQLHNLHWLCEIQPL
uniref:C-type lectin domain-containing protein n=1 Tax=Mastacembelus armatus TaxID=205130 RepID=A0A3Q3L3H2_9TELE